MIRTCTLFSFLLTIFLVGCKEAKAPSFTGTIEWTARAKDVPTLCYSYTFTRSDNGERLGIRLQNNSDHIFLEKFPDKTVEIEGSFVTKERKFNAMEQRPLNVNGQPRQITCQYFSVSKINIAK